MSTKEYRTFSFIRIQTDYHHYLLLGQPEKRQKEINYFYQRTISVGGEKTQDLFLSRSCIISKYLWWEDDHKDEMLAEKHWHTSLLLPWVSYKISKSINYNLIAPHDLSEINPSSSINLETKHFTIFLSSCSYFISAWDTNKYLTSSLLTIVS